MDYATQSSRVGARVPYSLLKVLLRSYILPLRGGFTWPWPVGVPLAPCSVPRGYGPEVLEVL